MNSDLSDFAGARASLLAACGEMERMLGGLDDAKGQVAVEIHELRRLGKRLRGGLAMIDDAKPCLRWISVIGRMLGGLRDATVRAKTWKKLGFEESAPGSIEEAITALLDLEAAGAKRVPPAAVIGWSLAALDQVKGRLEARTDEETAAAAAEGATRLEKQLRKRLKRALQQVRNEDFHDCRKAVKAWLGGMSLVAPERALAGGPEAGKLADSLGEENDLEVLAGWLRGRGFTPSATPAGWKVLRKRQEKLRRRSISLIRKELLPALGR
jgi:CHAD domain-containing protein